MEIQTHLDKDHVRQFGISLWSVGRYPVVPLLLLIAVTSVAYYSGLFGDYIFDDFPNLLNNPQIQISGLDYDTLKAAAFSSGAGMLRRPISMLSFALNYYFFGIHPLSFKLVNLIIHLACGLSLFFLATKLLFAFRQIHRPGLPDQFVYRAALAATAAWLLHPLNLTGVLFVVQRMTTLSALFMVLGLYSYVIGRMQEWEGKSGYYLIIAGFAGFGLLALLSKESGALLPLYMLAIEATLFRFRNLDGKISRKTVWLFLAIFVLPAVGALTWLAFEPQRFLGGYALRTFTLPERLLTEARVILFYVKLILVPSVDQLGIYHDDFAISSGFFSPITTPFAVLAVIALPIAAILYARKAPLLALGVLWFFAGHVLESTFLPLEIAFEHRNYLADFGPILVLCCLLLDPTRSPKTLSIRGFGLLAYISFLFLVTYMRAGQWSNDVDQALTEAQHHPNSPRAEYSAGRILVNLVLTKQLDDPIPAFQHLERARTLDTDGIAPEVGLIISSSKIGRDIHPSWITSIKAKLRYKPITSANVASVRTLIECQERQCKIPDSEILSILDAAFENPKLTLVQSVYADMLTIRGGFLIARLNDFKSGKELFQKSVEVQPHKPQYRINLINLLLVMRLDADARDQLEKLKSVNTYGQFPDQIRTFEDELSALTPHKVDGTDLRAPSRSP